MTDVVFSISEKTADRLKELMFDDSNSNWTVAPIQTSSFGDGTELALMAFVLPRKELTFQLSFRMESNHSVVFHSITTERLTKFSKETWVDDFGAYTNTVFDSGSVEIFGTKFGVKISATMSVSFDIDIHGINELYGRLVEISKFPSNVDVVSHRTLVEKKLDNSTFRIFLAFSKRDPITLIGQEIFGESEFGDTYSKPMFLVSSCEVGISDISSIHSPRKLCDILESFERKLHPSYFLKFNVID